MMHQGWKCFMQGYASGLFSIVAVIEAAKFDNSLYLFTTLAIVLFWFGGSNAEKLTKL